MRVLRSGRLHRYNTQDDEQSQTSQLEVEFAAAMGAKYCLAVASGGYAMATALRALGVAPGDPVLTNAFTLAPVPGAIAGLGAVPVFVGVTEALTLDLDDFAHKAATSAAKVLLLSHMRGHLCDMDRLMQIADDAGIAVVEDCAHTMGARWNGAMSGTQGVFACYSTQTYKHLNSGEGGLLVSDDPTLMARAIILSGSYMLYDRHAAGPPPEVFDQLRYETPNISGRMDNLRAAILRPQLARLAHQITRWNALYRVVHDGLGDTPGLTVIERPSKESYVGSSIQFLLLDWAPDAVAEVLTRCAAQGVDLKWFGAAEPSGFTSRYDSWRYVTAPRMPATDRILGGIVDMRLPLTFSQDDCALIARIIRAQVSAVWQARAA